MASRHFSVKHGKVGRGKKHAQYIGGQANYADKDDVVFLLDVNMPSWARDGVDFFDAADKLERANGRTYTEFEFAIPREINDPVEYVQKLAINLLGKDHPYRLAVHDKLASDGGQNTHGHLMFTERKLDEFQRDIDHFFLRANSKNPEKGGTAKDRKWNAKDMVEVMRQEYSDFAKSYGVDLDLRSNLAQGLAEAEPKIGPIHDRSNQNKNRDNLTSKVELLRDERLAKAGIDPLQQKQKYELQQKAQERRKQLWTSFHKQRRSNYSRLADEFKVTHVHQKEKLALIKSEYLKKRESLKNDRTLKYVDRRVAISIANMERITQELALKAELESIRNAIKIEQNEHYFEKYSAYLEGQAQEGDEVAQAELIRLTANKRKLPEEHNSIVAIGTINKLDPAHINLKYEVSRAGDITYKMRGLDVIKDVGKRVDLLQTDDLTIETALRLAQAKFGSKLTLTGSREFQERVAMIAVERSLNVEFTDPEINSIMQQHKQGLAVQREMQMIERNLIAAGKKLQGIEHIDQKAQAAIVLNVAGLETGYVLESSFAEAKRIVLAKGFDSVKVTNLNYRGSVIAVTAHHVIQNIGKNKVVIHELAKIQGKLKIEVGTKLDIKYHSANQIANVEHGSKSQKPHTR